MRIKRYISLCLAMAVLLGLTACGADEDKSKDAAMTIAPAQLTEEEQSLTQLLALGMESHRIFEFQAKGAKTLHFNIYELVDGNWSRIQGGGGAGLSAENGRIALTFGKMTDGVRMAFQTEGNEIISTSIQPEPADDVSAMTFATSVLGETKTIELDQEIPLAVQVVTSKQEISSYHVDYFGMPREYAKHEYEHVYAITVVFSGQDLGAPPSVAPSAETSLAN